MKKLNKKQEKQLLCFWMLHLNQRFLTGVNGVNFIYRGGKFFGPTEGTNLKTKENFHFQR